MENNELSIKITASMNKALESINKFIPKVKETDNVVTKMLAHMDKNGQLTGFTVELKNLESEMEKITKTSKNFKNAFNLGATFAVASKIARTGLNWIKNSTDYSEALNLFNVVLDDTTNKAIRFQNIMNEAFGTNQAETLTRQGLYQSMAENMGIASNYAYIMSENTTKLVNDISSLYNKDENTVAEALRAGIFAGQTKPLRSFGMDITENTLQPELERLGIDRTIRDLSQAEKQLLRYISVLRQSQEAHGDWANTIEAPANQLKILKNQVVEASKSLSNLFVGAFGSMLPYANAILMVIEEVSNAIATMFGIEISDYNSGIADMSNAFVDVEDSIDDATGSAKELKRQVLGFDQINNINDNKNSGSGGSSVSGGIDQRLLDAITGYDNGMERVRMKAIQIRDNIMEWLGFTKEINPLTGKVSFKYEGINTTLKNVLNSFKGLSTEGKILAGLGLVAGATSLWKTSKKLISVFGNSGLGKVLKSLLSPAKSLLDWMKLGVKVNGNLTSGLKDGILAWREQNVVVRDAKDNIVVWKTALNGVINALKGLAVAGGSFLILDNAMKDMTDNGVNLVNILGAVSGSLGTISGLAQAGSVFGPIGTAIGAVTGGLISLYDVYMKMPTEVTKTTSALKEQNQQMNEYLETLSQEKQIIQENLNNNLIMTGVHKELVDELETLVDANGKVKKGYETRVEFILNELSGAYGIESTLVDGIVGDYKNYIKNIEKLIKTKEAEYILEANREAYVKEIKNENELWAKKEEQIKKTADAQKAYDEAMAEITEKQKTYDELLMYAGEEVNIQAIILGIELRKLKKNAGELKTELENAVEEETNATNKYKENQIEKIKYSNVATSVITGDYEKIEESINEFTDSYIKDGEIIKESLDQRIKHEKDNLDIIAEAYKTYATDTTKMLYENQKEKYNNLVNSLLEETKAIEELTDEQATAWGELAKADKGSFLEVFKQLPEDIQQEVVDKMQDKGYSISDELQKGINQINPTIKVKADTSSANATIKSFFTNLPSKVIDFFGGSKKADGGVYANGKWHNIAQYASGGLPSMGQMFIAREKGPELVGTIGSHTAVMNNNQIVESVKAGVYEAVAMAMSNTGGTSVDINVRADEGIIVEKAVNGIQQHVIRTGELPFTVPV